MTNSSWSPQNLHLGESENWALCKNPPVGIEPCKILQIRSHSCLGNTLL